MTDILLIIIIALLAYVIHILKEHTGNGKKEEKKMSYQKVLPEYLNKMCEITLKEPLVALDIEKYMKHQLILRKNEPIEIHEIDLEEETV